MNLKTEVVGMGLVELLGEGLVVGLGDLALLIKKMEDTTLHLRAKINNEHSPKANT